jgi:sterol desaturase/sphingolipid hydroxylase (fatty acid hydroxylase superfamily)
MDTLQPYLATFAIDVFRLVIWLILLLAIFIPLERLCKIHVQKVFRKAFSTDLVYYFMSSLSPKLLLVMPLTMFTMAIHAVVPMGFYASVAALPLWLRLAGAMLVGEIGFYWGHRWSHQLPLLWRFHAIHHSAEELDWLVNTRAHPVDIVFTRLCGSLPMYALGLAQPMGNTLDLVPIIVTLVGSMWGFFIHANLRWRFGPLEWLVSTPAFHHWHHTNDSAEHLNKNYASMIPLLDWCFGTHYLPKELPEKYGTDTHVASGLGAQLLDPLLPGSEPFVSKPDPVA